MFENRLKEISKKIGSGENKYYILTHKRHKREIYFKNSKQSYFFMEFKFHSFIKMIIYFLIRTGLLQPFLKKIKLSEEFGDVIFIGNKITSFNLKKKEVLSFPLNENDNNEFIKSKKFQKKIAEHGFASQVYEINEKIPYSREELLEVFEGDNYIGVFKKILDFYNFMGIERASEDSNLLITTLHGDFAKENILVKNGKIVFCDWNPYKGLLLNDLINFFRGEKRLSKNKQFKNLLRLYPKTVQENFELYLNYSLYSFIE